jgi:hypothetical protein
MSQSQELNKDQSMSLGRVAQRFKVCIPSHSSSMAYVLAESWNIRSSINRP